MTANLFGDRFVGVRKPAWHGLGRVYENAPGVVEAMQENHLDFNIHLRPLFADVNLPGANDAGLVPMVPLESKCAIMREPTHDDQEWRFLGVAGEGYSVIQNTDIGRLIEPLANLWPLETIGALGGGETIFITLKAGGATVHGEDIEQYFLITDTRNGGTSMKIAFTPVRVVCQNTLISGLNAATVTTNLQHTGEIVNDLRLRVSLLEKMHRAMGNTIEQFEILANTTVSDREADEIFRAAYPDPKRPMNAALLDGYTDAQARAELGDLYDVASGAAHTFEYYCNRASTYRAAVFGVYANVCQNQPAIAGTAWAAYNAVVEFADFREGRDEKNIAVSSLFGYRAAEKKRAFAEALAISR